MMRWTGTRRSFGVGCLIRQSAGRVARKTYIVLSYTLCCFVSWCFGSSLVSLSLSLAMSVRFAEDVGIGIARDESFRARMERHRLYGRGQSERLWMEMEEHRTFVEHFFKRHYDATGYFVRHWSRPRKNPIYVE